MKKYILIFTLIMVWSCTDMDKIVDEIVIRNMMESEYVGFGGTKSDEYRRFQKIKSKASDEELDKLINHINPIVRTYGFLA